MDEEAKLKHSKRIQQKENHIKKQVDIAKQHGLGFVDEVIQQPHRLAKHNVLDCVNPRKVLKERTKQEKSFDQTRVWETE